MYLAFVFYIIINILIILFALQKITLRNELFYCMILKQKDNFIFLNCE